jgi:hypothetical protein
MVLLPGVEFSLTWDNAKWKAMINATKDQLKAAPEFKYEDKFKRRFSRLADSFRSPFWSHRFSAYGPSQAARSWMRTPGSCSTISPKIIFSTGSTTQGLTDLTE